MVGTEPEPQDVQATFCATLVDEWIERGVRHAVVAPGSRSTPMAIALATRDEIALHVVHDERVAAFVALGIAVADAGRPGIAAAPALLLCTSGTAAANFLPAVVEAGLSEIPMIVLTADRPEELRGVGAPQTIDQIELYGVHVRSFADPGVPELDASTTWRPLAATAVAESRRGPVHVNLAFREPLVGTSGPLPERISPDDSVVDSDARSTDPVPAGLDVERGVVLVGGAHGQDPEAIRELGRRTGWPLITDATSAVRADADVTVADAILRHDDAARDLRPAVIVRIGRPSASKILAQWSHDAGAMIIQIGGPGVVDPGHDVTARCSLDDVLAAVPPRGDGEHRAELEGGAWLTRWRSLERAVHDAWEPLLVDTELLTEPAAARAIADHLPAGSTLTVSSSMPVRDLEWFGGAQAIAHSNRGANGIDGVISTALGRALASRLAGVLLIGDLAFVHDSNALVALTKRSVDLRIVVVDNDGGGIFSFLSQAQILGSDRFEQLFGTPLGTDVLGLARAHGLSTYDVSTRSELIDVLLRPGPWVCRIGSDRRRNVADHDALHDVGRRAVDEALNALDRTL